MSARPSWMQALVPSHKPFQPSRRRTFRPPLMIGVVSDTHVFPQGARRLPSEVGELFRRFQVGLIVHAGDVNTASVLEELAEIAPVMAVTGNNDEPGLMDALPQQVRFAVGTHQFAVIHGHGGRSARSEATLLAQSDDRLDCVIYGHSHVPLIEREQATILFNPGSATDRRWSDYFGVGLIMVTATDIKPELVLYQDPRHLANISP